MPWNSRNLRGGPKLPKCRRKSEMASTSRSAIEGLPSSGRRGSVRLRERANGSSRKGKHETSIIDEEEDQVDGVIALAYVPQNRCRSGGAPESWMPSGVACVGGTARASSDGMVARGRSSAAGAQQMRDLANCTTTDLPGATVSFRALDSHTRCTCACSVLNA